MSDIRYRSYPRTEPPPPFVGQIIGVFERYEAEIGTPPAEEKVLVKTA